MMDRIRSAARTAVIQQRIEDGELRGMQHLAERRRRLNLTMEEVGLRAGVPKQTYCNWETCRYWPSGNYLPALALALQCTIEELFLPPEEDER